jgi:sulfoxide reductase heme-binding subunit YedZ
MLGRLVKAKPLTWFHESLGIAALLASGVHVVVLTMHEYLEFTWTEILVPGASDWRRGAVTFGVVSLYGLVIVVASFYIKKHIGQKTWRLIHFASLGVFLASLIHGVSAGTDTRTPLMIGLYVGSAAVVGLLLAARLTRAGETGRSPRPRGPGPDTTDRPAPRVPTPITDTRGSL